MSAILSIDTTTEACSVALATGSGVITREAIVRRGHSQHVLDMVTAVLAEAQMGLGGLAAIACCRGPGSFTGVRIGVGVAHGLALGTDLPLVAVSTLATVAQGAYREHAPPRVLVAMDARMGEVYWGCFAIREARAELHGEEHVGAPEAVALAGDDGDWMGTGTGFAVFGEALAVATGPRLGRVDANRLPHARDCLPLARAEYARTGGSAPETVVPVYLRDRVAAR